MKWCTLFIAAFPLFVLSGCVGAKQAPPVNRMACEALNIDAQSSVLVGTDLSTFDQFSSAVVIEPAHYLTDMGGAELSVLIAELSSQKATLSYEEPGITSEQVEATFTCIGNGVAENDAVTLNAVEGGVLLKFKKGFFHTFSFDGWVFLEKK